MSITSRDRNDRQEVLSNLIQRLVKEKEDPDLHLRIYNEEALEKTIYFKKKTESEIPLIKLTFYNATTKKQEEVKFYNYMLHLDLFSYKLNKRIKRFNRTY